MISSIDDELGIREVSISLHADSYELELSLLFSA